MKSTLGTLAVIGACSAASLAHAQTTWQDLMPPPQQPWALAPLPTDRPDLQSFPETNRPTTWRELMLRQQPSAPAPPQQPENRPFPGMDAQTTWPGLLPRQQFPAPIPPDRPASQPFPRMPNEHESWVLSGGAYTTFRASNTMTLEQMTSQMLAHGVPASTAEKAAPEMLRALKSVPIRGGAAVVAVGLAGWALYEHFFSGKEQPLAQGSLK